VSGYDNDIAEGIRNAVGMTTVYVMGAAHPHFWQEDKEAGKPGDSFESYLVDPSPSFGSSRIM
jgi:hypothetical protein